MGQDLQKEILQVLIDLYKKSNYRPVKGEEIAEVIANADIGMVQVLKTIKEKMNQKE